MRVDFAETRNLHTDDSILNMQGQWVALFPRISWVLCIYRKQSSAKHPLDHYNGNLGSNELLFLFQYQTSQSVEQNPSSLLLPFSKHTSCSQFWVILHGSNCSCNMCMRRHWNCWSFESFLICSKRSELWIEIRFVYLTYYFVLFLFTMLSTLWTMTYRKSSLICISYEMKFVAF